MSDNALQIIVDELAAARKSEAEFRKAHAALLARLNDDALALKIAKGCHDTIHDAEEWCDTCGIRADGIAAYRNAVRGGSDGTT